MRRAAIVATAALAVTGCESTQDKSARLEAQAATKGEAGRGLVVRERSRDVRAVRAEALQDANGTAVVVELRNRSDRALTRIPLAIQVRGRDRSVLYANDVAGLDESLVQVPALAPGERLLWVNDQVTAAERPAKVRAAVGADAEPVDSLPRLAVGGVRLQGDPVSGVAAVGKLTNRSSVEQRRVVVFAVAREGRRVVAAGRAIVNRVRPGRSAPFQAFFIGDPRGAQLEVAAPPTVIEP
jgi:hypothetical protein